MKRSILCLLIPVLLCISLLGCTSPLASAVAAREKKYACEELDLSAVRSSDAGFHHPTISWDISRSEIAGETGWSFKSVVGYLDNNEVIYSAQGPYTMIEGVRCDQVTLTVDTNDEPYAVTLIFMPEEKAEGTPLKDLFESYRKTLTEHFGEPEETESRQNVNGSASLTTTLDWTCEDAQGRKTHLQFAASHLSGAAEYSYLGLGFSLERD